MTPEEEIEMLKAALKDAHGIIEEGVRTLNKPTLNTEEFDWIHNAKELLENDKRLL